MDLLTCRVCIASVFGGLFVVGFFFFTFWPHRTAWDLSFPSRDQTSALYHGSGVLNYWTTREVPIASVLIWRRKWQSIPAFLPGKSHRGRSLVSYSPWGPKTWPNCFMHQSRLFSYKQQKAVMGH